MQVTTTVFNAENDEIVWMRTYARPFDPQSLMNVQRELASEIATVVGQSYGVVRNDIRADPPRNMESYLCVLRAQAYRSTFRRVDFDPAMQCLQQTVQRDPQYSDSWAMLGWLHLDAGRLGYSADGNPQTEYDKALDATSRAIALQPNSPLALKALAAAYHFTGRYADSDRISHLAIDLNPNDPDILAQFGWRLAIRGNFSEGVPMLKRAIERTLHRTHPTGAVLRDGWQFAKRVALSLALRSSGDAGRGFGRVGAAAALVAGRQGTDCRGDIGTGREGD
ncbi:tetratricopeptide repeat protein [Bradyrhizobium sp. USDA 4529]